MPSRSPVFAASLLSFSALDKLARTTGFIRRRSKKCSARGFVIALLQATIQGANSLGQLSSRLGQMEEKSMSRQAMHKRFSERSSAFLKEVLGAQLRQRGQRIFRSLCEAPFTRVLVEDSTVISMARSNACHFPNNGNGRFMTAGCKVNVVTDILRGKVVSSELCPARLPDQKLAHIIVEQCRPGDLILRDKGYFAVHAILGIEEKAAFWVSRLPASVNASKRDGTPLAQVLKHTKKNRLDLRITIGARNPHTCRLVATRLTRQEAEKNRRYRKSEAKRRQGTPKAEGLLRDGWSLLITNLPTRGVPSGFIYDLYSLRWGIEISFRALKQSCRLQQSLRHKSSRHQIEAMVLAAMIHHALSVQTHAQLQRSCEADMIGFSLEKVANRLAHYLLTITKDSWDHPFIPDLRHLRHDRRKRLTLFQSLLSIFG